MAHIELNVTGAVACEGIGSYFASIYYADPSYRTKYKLAPLGRERPDTSKPAVLIEQLRKSMPAAARSLTVPIERFVAFSLLSACPLDRHADGAYMPGMGLRAERLASFVVAASLDDIEAIQPLRPDEAPSAHGFGKARRIIPHTLPINPLIHLPVTSEEAYRYPLESAVRALPARGLSSDPYVALHSTAIEQIVTPDMLG